MMHTEKVLLRAAKKDPRGLVYPKTARQEAAVTWLHTEGYGIYCATPHPARFQLFKHKR